MRSLSPNLRVVVTRAAHQAEELAAPLRALGADVLLLPTIGIAPSSDPQGLRDAASRCNLYDWIIFTSANGVEAFAQALEDAGKTFPGKIATVGAATREAAEKRGLTVAVMPSNYVAEALAEAFEHEDLNGKRLLIPSAAVTRDVVPDALRRRGAEVHVVEAYRNILPEKTVQAAPTIFREPYPDWVLFASSSAVDNLVRVVGTAALQHVKIVTIGPVTSDTVRRHGLTVTAQASTSTVQGLVNAVQARQY